MGHFLAHHHHSAVYERSFADPAVAADFAQSMQEVSGDVSVRARANFREFIAEVFVALATGHTFTNPRLLHWYNYFGGVMP